MFGLRTCLVFQYTKVLQHNHDNVWFYKIPWSADVMFGWDWTHAAPDHSEPIWEHFGDVFNQHVQIVGARPPYCLIN